MRGAKALTGGPDCAALAQRLRKAEDLLWDASVPHKKIAAELQPIVSALVPAEMGAVTGEIPWCAKRLACCLDAAGGRWSLRSRS